MTVRPPLRDEERLSEMETVTYDLWIDFQSKESNGVTPTLARFARPGVELRPGAYVTVGSDDSEVAVGEVVDVQENGVVMARVLPGPAEAHLDLVTPGRTERY